LPVGKLVPLPWSPGTHPSLLMLRLPSLLNRADATRKAPPKNPITLENWPRVDAKWYGFRYQASYITQFMKGP